ncbi:MAG TPA: 1,2-phenylacetyl-CoA epoxidase subunit PaaC [Streptosporangiaceae bacterium]
MSTPDPRAGHDSPYDLLAQDHDDGHRWAFGTGFTDPLEGIDTSVPAGLDAAALARYCLALGDDALIYSHRLQQWVTRMPELEEETAIANIALDLLGQARMLLARAGAILGRTEDELAFFRPEGEFRNVRLAEHEDRDFAELTGRLLIFSAWRLALFEELSGAPDPVLAAIAAKGVKELTYHRDYAAQWVIRLGDGTGLSHQRMQRALTALWPLAGELFRPDPDALAMVEPIVIDAVLGSVLSLGGLDHPGVPAPAGVPGPAGRAGVHTGAMAPLLAELQSLARAHPDATW